MLPSSIFSGNWKTGHVQGIAIDTAREYIYYSFTTVLVKSDMRGNIIGSVGGIVGHLGCLDFCDADGRVYGSLEYKQDAIGRGILDMIGSSAKLENAFYIAAFDGSKITRMDMDAERDGIMTAVYLKDVVDDFEGVGVDGVTPHRYGCSGIDGTAFGPAFGTRGGKTYLNVAYGIYADTARGDNDYQIILSYDTSDWGTYERPLKQDALHHSGPDKPHARYFVYTGNTTYGVQNLEYDGYTGNWFFAVYPGKKPAYPNHPFYIVDGSKAPVRAQLKGFPEGTEGLTLTLLEDGIPDKQSGVWGWDFPHGDTGLFALDDGRYYISHHGRTNTGLQNSTVYLYRWTGHPPAPFTLE
ncbi:MAG: hypothetical protein ACOXZM_04125 [Eubacteriales bacterium]|jgi:hypothetical protein